LKKKCIKVWQTGHYENLIPQLQFAGFRIDIVYDPGMGFLKLQLNVMVQKYHSGREAYFTTDTDKKTLESRFCIS
jgi:hypothetical protein